MQPNTKAGERLASMAVGGLLVTWAFRKRSPATMAAGIVGADHIYRGASGHCPLYGALAVMMNKGLTVRTAQQHGQKYVPRLIEHTLRGELDVSFLATHRYTIDDGPRGYDMFKTKAEGCLRVVFAPQA